MTNEEIWVWMQRDLDGDLSREEQQLLHSLVRKDSGLQLMYNRLKTVSQQLEQLPPVTPSFSIVDSILPKLESAAATAAARPSQHEEFLPTLEVKRHSSLPSESKKWKRLTVLLARIGSTAVAACLLIGMVFMGSDAKKHELDPSQQGAQMSPAVEKPALIGPPVPPPSTNPSPLITSVEEKQSQNGKTQAKKTQAKTTSKPGKKTPAAKPSSKPAKTKHAVPPTPAMKEEKPPAFPIGLEENPDKDDKHREKDDESEKEDDKRNRNEEKRDK